MPIFFSNGFVVEDNPKRAIICKPAVLVSEVSLNSVIVSELTLKAVWQCELEGC